GGRFTSRSDQAPDTRMTPHARCAMMRPMGYRWSTALGATVALALGVLGCAIPQVQPQAGPACSSTALPTLDPQTFTFGTDRPAYPPWYIGDDPTNGAGFEAAVAYAVAERLGYAREHVRWVRIPFNTAMAPGPKPF